MTYSGRRFQIQIFGSTSTPRPYTLTLNPIALDWIDPDSSASGRYVGPRAVAQSKCLLAASAFAAARGSHSSGHSCCDCAANVVKELSDLIMRMPLQAGAQVSGLRRASTSEDEHGPGSDRTGLMSRTPCMSIAAQQMLQKQVSKSNISFCTRL